jgi:hypothetical protein
MAGVFHGHDGATARELDRVIEEAVTTVDSKWQAG